ncbi:Oxygen-insensitive NADPH nitroreductase RdxA [Helicobacter sp. NHP19-012]|uniref:Oxygen-insensitive NADPH nitroreductase RdxA n=1 Tax=Helicobacter gastrofelis TaxID=2849642 RepID=A0ABM7SHK1_9HELI|nr:MULTISPECIES: NAD(P)H-dependent oxidoreductase [unclassified Helicobacter]BCZ19423.1 Oxygen-insensitive NADPH nitroreductase RdxA [Helicobacter sp. NHP19-012]GMB96414.1 Oxygen-insensitive NADPH nitroreductase RdxA [Helicobacter sp. NHP22-001]
MQTLSPMALNSFLHRRFACKKFDPNTPLSKEVLEQILEAARLAPSSYNTQPWEFVVLQGAMKDKLLPYVYFNTELVKSCAVLVVVGYMHFSELNAAYLSRFYTKEYHERVSKGVEVLLKERLKNDQTLIEAYMKEQCYIAVGQMTLAATLMGVDSCIIGGFEAQKVQSVLNAYFNPPNIACLVALGKAAMPTTIKARKEKGSAIKYLL